MHLSFQIEDGGVGTVASADTCACGLLERAWRFPASVGMPTLAFWVCAVLGLATIWGHRYPAGVDLPQHANLVRLWADLERGPPEYRRMYQVECFTPYFLPYAFAVPITRLFGALVAIKVLLTVEAMATPLLLARWLKTVGATPGFGLVGFVVAFDYGYVWGFISYAFAIPLLFAYLTEFELQGDRPRAWAVVRASIVATAIFFSHGIVFALSVVTVVTSLAARPHPWTRWRRGLHLVPLAALALVWIALRQRQPTGHAIEEWFTWDRALLLFSGAFVPYANRSWALVGAAGCALFLLVARPRLTLGAARTTPLALALVVFVASPEWFASTWLVASRFCVFVHAFAGGSLTPRRDLVARQWPRVLAALVIAFIVLVNVRLWAFNRELSGLDVIAQSIPPGSDVETLVPDTDNVSDAFGPAELGQVPAWITALRGGLIANDSSIYYQIPIQKRVGWSPANYRYVVARGSLQQYGGLIDRLTGRATLLAASGPWLLLERHPMQGDGFTVVRTGQGWGDLRLNLSSDGTPLTVASQIYGTGLGTHAPSFVRLQLDRPAQIFKGACGLDDESPGCQGVSCQIVDAHERSLWDSGPVIAGAPAATFSVPLEGQRALWLYVNAPGSIDHCHTDWVGLRLQ